MFNCRLSSRLTRDFLPLNLPVAVKTDRTGAEAIVTNEAFLSRSAAWAAGFKKAKAAGSSRAALFFEDTVDFAAALFGAWRVGIMTVLLPDALPATLEKVAEASAIDCTAGNCENAGLPAVTPLVDEPLALFADEPLDETAELLALLTSGSTGEAKVIPKRLEQLFIEVEGIDRAMADYGLGSGALRVDAPLPLFFATVTHQHIYGLLFRALWPLLGIGLMTNERLHYPEALAAAMKATDDSPIFVVSSPAHLKRLDDPSLFEGLAERILFVSSSAGPLDDAGAEKSLKAFGRLPFEILGSTETGGIARRMREMTADGLVTPAWVAMPGVDMGIEPSADAPIVALSELTRQSDIVWPVTGRLALKTPQLAGPDFELGGDNIEIEKNGAFRLIGRADRIVKVEGKRVSLAMIEKPLAASPWIAQAKALLLTGRRDEIGVVLELTSEGRDALFEKGKHALTQELRAILTDSIDPVALPKRWRLVEKMPVNAQGKSPVVLLKTLFDARHLEWMTIEKETEPARRVTLRTTLPTHLAWFRGHFPDRLILPGVGILKLTSDAARDVFGLETALLQVRNLKFKSMMKPQQTMLLTLTEKKPGEIRFLWSRLNADGSLFEQAVGILVFAQ